MQPDKLGQKAKMESDSVTHGYYRKVNGEISRVEITPAGVKNGVKQFKVEGLSGDVNCFVSEGEPLLVLDKDMKNPVKESYVDEEEKLEAAAIISQRINTKQG
ncbi:MAG TPA: hypothetical protein VGO21_05630 [Candidatus Paceibacterota bacterium]|jgi:hypothetical protein|nr:hypothetical protein [Candidatus Paceibacterota bacterium]